MVRLAPVDLPALLDQLERGESKDSLDLLASRVCLDLLVLQEKEESPETRVFLVRVELLVLLELEVSVVSPVREVVLGLRVCRDHVDFPEPPELMDPRELLDQLVHLEPKAPLVCRACPEREELVESQDQRETGVTTEQRDPRELLERMALEV